jgi:hypothetical protein
MLILTTKERSKYPLVHPKVPSYIKYDPVLLIRDENRPSTECSFLSSPCSGRLPNYSSPITKTTLKRYNCIIVIRDSWNSTRWHHLSRTILIGSRYRLGGIETQECHRLRGTSQSLNLGLWVFKRVRHRWSSPGMTYHWR